MGDVRRKILTLPVPPSSHCATKTGALFVGHGTVSSVLYQSTHQLARLFSGEDQLYFSLWNPNDATYQDVGPYSSPYVGMCQPNTECAATVELDVPPSVFDRSVCLPAVCLIAAGAPLPGATTSASPVPTTARLTASSRHSIKQTRLNSPFSTRVSTSRTTTRQGRRASSSSSVWSQGIAPPSRHRCFRAVVEPTQTSAARSPSTLHPMLRVDARRHAT